MSADELKRLSELRVQSASALEWIANLPKSHRESPAVCWNIGWSNAASAADEASILEIAQALSDELRQLDAPFLEPPVDLYCLGGEIIEHSMPTPKWLETRLAILPAILERHGLRIHGWAYEPRGCRAFNGWVPQAWCFRETDVDAQTH